MKGDIQEYSLGPLPWSEEVLRKAYFRDFVGTRKAIKEHPGDRADEDLLDLSFSVQVFVDSVAELLESIGAFDSESRCDKFWTRLNHPRVEHLERAIRRGFFAAAASALA